MICVTIGRGRHSSLAAEWKAAADEGADLVELRVDCLRREPDLKRILAKRHTPLIFTCRRGADGGLWRGSEEKRQKLLREAIVLGVDYVDLERDIASSIPRFGKTKRIISYHNLKSTPAEISDIADSCAEQDADTVKVATNALSLADGVRLLKMASKMKVPTIAIGMGEMGFFTRMLGAKYGAPFTFTTPNPERVYAPGMPLFHYVKHDYFYNQINRETQVFAVIGDPIGHSLSPPVHNASFREIGLNNVMVPILIPEGTLRRSLLDLEWLGIKGFSVTIPHKEAMVPLLDKMDGAVEKTGSCNTAIVDAEGNRTGYNTDYRAAMSALEDALGGPPETTDDKSLLLDKQVLVLGAGGVARSICFGLARRGASVTIANRHDERSSRLAEEVGCRSITWSTRASTLSNVMINCTPVGMHPDVDETPVPPAAFRPGMIVFDTVYHPENTMFLKLARERECVTVTGVDMFVRQAAHQFQLFTGKPAPLDLMRDIVKHKLGPFRP
jgi:3-dehydroquinate dehydratase/shikimate dehydrogenase